ncbi:MAG: hypothetical protein HC844_02570 [Tabrizicola sp.]|nr:hypothetical protein [Tabrizicola sp.]
MAFYIATDDRAVYTIGVHKRGDRFAAAMFVTNQADHEAEQQALTETVFSPSAEAPTAPPAVAANWPAPLTSQVATTRPRLSVLQAETMRLDPEHVPITGDFGCFIVEQPRPMTPTPDVTLTFRPGFTYAITDGKAKGEGRWSLAPNDTFDRVVELDGTLEREGYIVVGARDDGQVIHIDNPFAEDEQELLCLQEGPTLEREIQAMARVAVGQGLMACTDAEGKSYSFVYGNGIYSVPEGKGYVETSLESYSGDTWDGVFRFTSGPLSLYGGKMTGEGDGTLTLELSTEWRTGSLFYSSTETTIHARCRMTVAARPLPIYGLDAPPPVVAPEGGLPEGLYRSFEGTNEFTGTSVNYVFRTFLTYVAPGGRILRDVDLDEIGDLPDCTRSRLDGHAFCGEYRIAGQTIQRRDEGEREDEDWTDAEPFALTETGFEIDGTEYTRLDPLSADLLPGIWVADSFTGSGPGYGGGVGVYTDADVYWSFTEDGRFEWAETATTQTLISPDPILGGVTGGGSSTSQDSGSGTYSVDGLWLVLAFDDGRRRRVTLFPSDSETPGVEIAGNSLKPG